MNSRRNPHRAGESGFDTDFLLVLAKTGDGAALGRLLERYRSYIGLLIRLQGRRQFRKNRDAEDLIHEIGLEIYGKIATFRGTSVHEFLRWVRRMIGSILADPVRPSPGTGCRDLPLERPLIHGSDHPSRDRDRGPVAPLSIPRHQAHRHERGVILADALEKLPDDCREVIILRHLEGLGFNEVARLMGRTEDSARRVWLRALALLGRTLEGLG